MMNNIFRRVETANKFMAIAKVIDYRHLMDENENMSLSSAKLTTLL